MQSDHPEVMLKSACSLSEPFALQVLGDSMEPEFKHGDIIVIEPDGPLRSGAYVLAKHEDEFIFRQLIIDENGAYFLKPLNPAYPTLAIPGAAAIHGLITSGGGTRRKSRKSYL
jgi:DNA polymerase V